MIRGVLLDLDETLVCRGQVVRIHSILELQLPVRAIALHRLAPRDLDLAVGRAVHQVVERRAHFGAEEALQILAVFRVAAKEETSVARQAADVTLPKQRQPVPAPSR